jgi:hypothetical protein
VTGVTFSNNGNVTGNNGTGDFWVVRLDASGNIQWQKCLGGDCLDRALAIEITPDGGYITSGATCSLTGEVIGNHGSYDYWIAKLSPDNLAISDFNQQSIVVCPNPACEQIQIQTHGLEKITAIKIITLDGKIVYEQNQYSNIIDVQNLAKGNYVLEAFSDGRKYISKFVKE